MQTPLHFDGHGVNDATGERIFKLSTKQWRDDGRGLEPEFVRLSNLFASAPELLEALKDLESMCNMPEVRQAMMKHNQAYYHGTMMQARKAISQAESEDY